MFENPLTVLWSGAVIAVVVWIFLSFLQSKNLNTLNREDHRAGTSMSSQNDFSVGNGVKFGFGFGIGLFLAFLIIGVASVFLFGATVAAFLQSLNPTMMGF